jgi:hypothetical protein
MKSLTVYTFTHSPEKQRLTMEARDPNGLWCIEMAKVPCADAKKSLVEMKDVGEDEDKSNDFYLTADFDQNLTLLQRTDREEEK